MTSRIVYIIWSKNKATGKETTTGFEYQFELIAKEVVKQLNVAFPNFIHRVEAITKDE